MAIVDVPICHGPRRLTHLVSLSSIATIHRFHNENSVSRFLSNPQNHHRIAAESARAVYMER
ncbi:MAG: hypothetical protein HRF51_07385 [bacterium]